MLLLFVEMLLDQAMVWLSEGGNYDYPDGTGVQVNAFLGGSAADKEQRTIVIQNKIRNDLDVQVGGVLIFMVLRKAVFGFQVPSLMLVPACLRCL